MESPLVVNLCVQSPRPMSGSDWRYLYRPGQYYACSFSTTIYRSLPIEYLLFLLRPPWCRLGWRISWKWGGNRRWNRGWACTLYFQGVCVPERHHIGGLSSCVCTPGGLSRGSPRKVSDSNPCFQKKGGMCCHRRGTHGCSMVSWVHVLMKNNFEWITE